MRNLTSFTARLQSKLNLVNPDSRLEHFRFNPHRKRITFRVSSKPRVLNDAPSDREPVRAARLTHSRKLPSFQITVAKGTITTYLISRLVVRSGFINIFRGERAVPCAKPGFRLSDLSGVNLFREVPRVLGYVRRSLCQARSCQRNWNRYFLGPTRSAMG